MDRSKRAVLIAAALAVSVVTGQAQQESTAPAERIPMRSGAPGRLSLGREVTTATLEQEWARFQQPIMEAAGIPPEKIERLKQMDIEARLAIARGEKPNLAERFRERNRLLTPEEQQRLREAQREYRSRLSATTGSATLTTTTREAAPE